MHILKRSSLQVSCSYMFRHRDDILTDSDKTKNIVQHTKLVILSPKMNWFIYLNTKLHKVDKHTIIKSRFSNIKTVQQLVTLSTSWLLFIFCLQQMYKHLSGSLWSKGVWSVWSVPCVILHFEASIVCFTFYRMLRGPCICLDKKGRKYLRYSRVDTSIQAETFGISAVYLQTKWTVDKLTVIYLSRQDQIL